MSPVCPGVPAATPPRFRPPGASSTQDWPGGRVRRTLKETTAAVVGPGSPGTWFPTDTEACSSAPIAFKGRLVQYAGRVLRPHPGKTTAEVHDYHDAATGVLASSLAKRAPGYTSLGFPDPRRSPVT
jgi:hypothetical protein